MEHFNEARILGLVHILTEFSSDCYDVARSTRHMSECERAGGPRRPSTASRTRSRPERSRVSWSHVLPERLADSSLDVAEVGVRTAWRSGQSMIRTRQRAAGATWLKHFVDSDAAW